MIDEELGLRAAMVRVARLASEQGLLCSSDGNLSARLGEARFLVTPSGCYKAAMEPGDLIVVDGGGKVLKGKPGARPSTEVLMHLEAYRQRPAVNAVLHAHPPYATALTLVEVPYPVDILPEVLIALGDVPTAPYATPGTPELAASIRELIRTHDSVLLSHHGSLNVGRTLDDTLIALERLEHAARTYCIARTLGPIVPLDAAELGRLRELGARLRAP
jgi:L-fuculose-phosphate aldolase